MSLNQFRFLIEKQEIPLLETALLLSKNISSPKLGISKWISETDKLAQEASENIPPFLSETERVHMLADWLFSNEGDGAKFSGNRKFYGDPRNSYIDQVLARRLGIPITLSVICIEVGERLGLNFKGVGLPGHFVVGGYVATERLPILFDPFNHGKHISQEECAKLVERTTGYAGEFEESWLQPSSNKMTIMRMLNNLRITFMRHENWPQAINVIRHLRIVQPDLAAHLRDEGLIQYHRGNYVEASKLLEEYLSQEPHAEDVNLIKTTVGAQFEQWAKLN